MAAGCSQECLQTDTFPLLMDHDSTMHSSEHVLNITDERDDFCRIGDQSNISPSSSHTETIISLNSSSTAATDQISSGSVSTQSICPPAPRMQRSSTSFESRQRTSPLNSGLWISIELMITLSQIIASIIVLSLSKDEKPKAPLSVWVVGYAAGCIATLPLLYWRYSYHYSRQQTEQTVQHASPAVESSNAWNLSRSTFPLTRESFSRGSDSHYLRFLARSQQMFTGGDQRMDAHIERFKVALDCFFAVWFIVGNVWIFGGHSSSREAPNLYRLCIVFLTFSCIGYAMPFIICATICCCLPCLITVIGFREDQEQVKGAEPELIEALPVYKFKRKNGSRDKGFKDPHCSDEETFDEGGSIGSGTRQEQLLSAEDAVCCICLGKYKDGVDLRELPCTHFFHMHCVDKWLKINSVCPLCKHDINVSAD